MLFSITIYHACTSPYHLLQEVHKTEKRLLELVQTFLKAIMSNISLLPPALREALAIVGDSVEKKFPGQSHVALCTQSVCDLL